MNFYFILLEDIVLGSAPSTGNIKCKNDEFAFNIHPKFNQKD